MKLALVQPPVWWTLDAPLGLAQVAGCARHEGHEVRVFDLNMELWKRRGQRYDNLWNWEQFHYWVDPAFVEGFFAENEGFLGGWIESVLRTDARVVGFSVYHGGQASTLALARRLKKADPKRVIVLGGQYFFKGDKASEMLADPAVDAVVAGAADESFPALLAQIERTGRPEPGPGVSVRGPGGPRHGGPPLALRDLERVPFADFSGFPLELYTFPEPRLPMAASRGCIWHCRFCSTREFWPGYTYMSGERIYAEMEHHKALYPHIPHFEFYDITFNGNMKSVADLAELLYNKGMSTGIKDYGFKVNAVLRPEMTPALLKKLKRVGLVDCIYGVESGSPRVLAKMNKNFTIETAETVLRDTHEAGINTTGNFMFGFPGETEEDFEMTLDFLRRNARSLDRAYASATFTSLEEFAYLTDNLDEFGVKRSDHNLYWETADGSNNYLVRQDRYERFRKLAISLGIDAYKGVNGTVEQDRRSNLAQYHRHAGEHLRAVENLLDYLELDFYSEPMRAELAAYRSDLERLLRGALFLRRGRLEAARGEFSAMREPAELLERDGKATLAWAKDPAPDLDKAKALLARAALFLDVAAAEIRSGEAVSAAPECKR